MSECKCVISGCTGRLCDDCESQFERSKVSLSQSQHPAWSRWLRNNPPKSLGIKTVYEIPAPTADKNFKVKKITLSRTEHPAWKQWFKANSLESLGIKVVTENGEEK